MSPPTGTTAVVTGSSRGIGLACAVRLARQGADIIGIGSSPESADQARAAVEAEGRNYTGLVADLAQRDQVYRVIDQVLSGAGVPDILVNAAGTTHREPATHHNDQAWDTVLEVNLTAPFILTRELGRGMVERGSGRVVFIASMLSFQGGLRALSYAASKGGAAQLVKAFSNEWASLGVNVNAVAPGYVATDMNAALREDADRFKEISDRIPVHRWAEPDDIAKVVAFLCTEGADYIHGTVVPVDGGWLGR